jgi:DNA ligase-1
MTLLAEVAAVSEALAATSSRLAKRAELGALLRRLGPDEIEPVVALLTGEFRQGRIGVGWATMAAVDPGPAPAEPQLTVAGLDAAVDAIMGTTGGGSAAARTELLTDLLGRATAAERVLVRRLFGEGLRQGALDGVMTDAVAAAAGCPVDDVRRAAMLTGSLPTAARIALLDGPTALRAVSLQVLRGVQPMLASTSSGVAAAIAELGLSSVEWKLDGARIQVHRHHDEIRVFTRSLHDVTARLPGVVEIVRSLPCRSAILDGEALLMGSDGRPLPFQDVMSRFGTAAPEAGAAGTAAPDSADDTPDSTDDRPDPGADLLAPFFFDVLHLDGSDLLDLTLVERLERLDRVCGDHRIPGTLTDDPTTAAAVLEEAMARGHEGVVVKGASTRYEAGRRGSAWRKVKPVRTLDLVVLAAEWGHGRRTGKLSNLHLGARGADGRFVMVGKTFKGLTDALLEWQTAELLAREVRRTGITVWVRPELVVEIALDGVQRSTRYPGGVALRFARVKRYRTDRDPGTADTVATVQAMLGGLHRAERSPDADTDDEVG